MNQQISKLSRIRILSVCVALLVLLLAGRLVQIQVYSHNHYLQISEENRIRVLPLRATRGQITDREGRLLVTDRPSYAISIIPAEVKDLNYLAGQLAPLLDLEAETIIDKVQRRRFQRQKPVRIRLDVGFETVCVIEESAELFPGVIYQLDHTRKYYHDDLACHLLGYTGEVDERESRSTHSPGTIIGRAGVEKRYDHLLRGVGGVEYVEVTATGRILGNLEEKPGIAATPGDQLALTIDLDLQMLADSLFADTLAGAAVFIDPKSGEILALVSKPTYDANLFSGVVRPDDYARLLANEQRPLFDRTISGTYPPGSVAKLMVAGAALQEGIITPETKFRPCLGGYQFGRRYFRCWKHSGHGNLDLYGAVEQSCDVYFYQLGLKMGLDTYAKYASATGFDQLTGIDIPAEKRGNVPNEEWYDRVIGKRNWTKAVLLNLAIGQGELLTTPLQLTVFFTGIANQGVVMKPRLLLYSKAPDGVLSRTSPEELHRLPFSDEVLAVLNECCRRVVHGEHGTAKWTAIPGIQMGGKTGTAQNPHGNEHSWYVGYAPWDDPVIVGCFIVEQAGHGSTVAAPFVKMVIERYLEKQNIIPPDSVIIVQEGRE